MPREEDTMPLSEYEQRVLDELERELGTDAALRTSLNRAPRARGRVVIATIGVALGLFVVVAGVSTKQPLVGVLGFALMTGAALWGLMPPARSAKKGSGASAAPKPGRAPRGEGGFMNRLEERFERRREEGDR